MTLAELRAIDFPATWARLTPVQQDAIGQAVLAWQVAQLVSDSTIEAETLVEAQDMANDALDGLADLVEASLPELNWACDMPPASPSAA